MHIEAPRRRKSSISLTPLIDVVFILLLFFMLATSFTDWRPITLATGTTSNQAQHPPAAVVHVAPDGTLRYAGHIRNAAKLAQLLNRKQSNHAISAVIVQPAPGTTLGPTVTALDMLAGSGLAVALGRSGKRREASP